MTLSQPRWKLPPWPRPHWKLPQRTLPDLKLPRWRGPRLPSWRALLPFTTGVIVLLVVVPAWQLRRFPRSSAAGVERLFTAAALIQSFGAAPDRPAPPLWQQRLGVPLAEQIWQRQRSQWWQFWGRHGDGGAYLAVPALTLGIGAAAPMPANSLKVDDLVVIAPDPLSRQLLQEELKRTLRPPRGLDQRCVDRLRSSQAVAWNNTALAQLAGPLAPLLQRFQQGCLVLGSDRLGLTWQGESSAAGDPAGPPVLPPAALRSTPLRPLPASMLLEVQGARLDLLLKALLTRELIREPLVDRYGLDTNLLQRLQSSPFLLRLRPQPSGPFLASLELQLGVGQDRAGWVKWLAALQKALEAQGLQQQPAAAPPTKGAATALATTIWKREDGTVVGGWSWLTPVGGSTEELMFFLGSVPTVVAAESTPAQPPPGLSLRLRARPTALAAKALLPADLPAVVRQAEQLEMISLTGGTGAAAPSPLSWLGGGLQLPPVAPPQPPAAPPQASGTGGR